MQFYIFKISAKNDLNGIFFNTKSTMKGIQRAIVKLYNYYTFNVHAKDYFQKKKKTSSKYNSIKVNDVVAYKYATVFFLSNIYIYKFE